jgi:hypothetical protein
MSVGLALNGRYRNDERNMDTLKIKYKLVIQRNISSICTE